MTQERKLDAASPGEPLDLATDEIERHTLRMVEQALRADRLMMAWQPVVVASEPARAVFHEGLIRVLDETGRIVPARDFMSAVETLELGRLIDCASLERGLAVLARNPALRLSVNMSARSIGHTRWMQILQGALRAEPSLGPRLILEITESSAMQVPELVVPFMDELQRAGIAFALDDFGAGFTAFRYLKDFFFDIIKIDGQFIRNIHRDPDNQVLTLAMLSVGRHFDMLTVAESVETAEEAEWLRAAGVDGLQGYLFGRPCTQPAWAPAGTRLIA
ncbi:EAL domain-containing protein [Cereibacter sediminicola]|uniref:EAL domain-containing protein n=1 Tax=Cereibacter sediminicola TaxID=2584941 RepID=UPI0011A29CB6|nr:EAL domain-containing protein [Cereibacter sediminicola]